MMRWWLDRGVDGFRMDVINMISKDPALPDGHELAGAPYGDGTPHVLCGPRIHEFLQEMHREVFAGRDAALRHDAGDGTLQRLAARAFAGGPHEDVDRLAAGARALCNEAVGSGFEHARIFAPIALPRRSASRLRDRRSARPGWRPRRSGSGGRGRRRFVYARGVYVT